VSSSESEAHEFPPSTRNLIYNHLHLLNALHITWRCQLVLTARLIRLAATRLRFNSDELAMCMLP
jgi:hypothetical protein